MRSEARPSTKPHLHHSARSYFSTWKHPRTLEDFPLPAVVVAAAAGGQRMAPFGDGVLRLRDTSLAGGALGPFPLFS